MIFRTRSGSLYEVDLEAKKIRRMSGGMEEGKEIAPTPRQGKDGEWKEYSSLFPDPPVQGTNLIIYWPPKTTPLLEGSLGGAPVTITSPIEKILEEIKLGLS